MDAIRVTIVQTDLHWEAIDANLEQFDQKLAHLTGHTDLVILPEMFTTGFSMSAADLAEEGEGKTINWLRHQAQKLQAAIMGSFIARENKQFYNRLLVMEPTGNYHTYDKKHLFTLAGEHTIYAPGKERLIWEWKGWRICPLICYDLRFPVWSRNTENYDLLIYVANFPAVRRYAWNNLLIARAIENQAYTIGVNRIGMDGKGIEYAGDSTILDFAGQVLTRFSYLEQTATFELSYPAQQTFRNKRQFLADRDHFEFTSNQ